MTGTAAASQRPIPQRSVPTSSIGMGSDNILGETDGTGSLQKNMSFRGKRIALVLQAGIQLLHRRPARHFPRSYNQRGRRLL